MEPQDKKIGKRPPNKVITKKRPNWHASLNTTPKSAIASTFSRASQNQSPTSEEIRNELNFSKYLIENLMVDNKMLHEDVEDFKKALQTVMNKCREVKVNSTQRDLELEKLKNAKMSLIQQQIAKENSKQSELIQTNVKLKERCIHLVELLRTSGVDISPDDYDSLVQTENLIKENTVLRELLQISRIADPKINDIDSVLNQQLDADQHRQNLQNYRKKKEEQKRSKSFSVGRSKSYLLGSPADQNNKGNMWDEFFKKQASRG